MRHSAVWQPGHEELAHYRELGKDPEYVEASTAMVRRMMELEAG